MKKAFTLVEILITVGIIGVVSALTVPNLMSNYQKESLAVQFRKTVLEFQNAFDMTITEEAKTSLRSTYVLKNNGINSFMAQKFAPVKTCTSNHTSDCFASSYKSLDGKITKAFKCDGNSYVLKNSVAACVSSTAASNTIVVQVDLNGQEPPNIGGRDMFVFGISPNGMAEPAAPDAFNNTNAACDKCKKDYDPVTNPQGYGNNCMATGKPCNLYNSGAVCTDNAFGAGCYERLSKDGWKMNY